MRATYTGHGVTIILDFVGESVGDRELRAQSRKGQQLPDGFAEALRAVADESKARAISDKREAFLAIQQDMRARGFEFVETSRERGVHLEMNMASGRSMTRAAPAAAAGGANQGLMESIAAGITRALQGLLVTQPEKLQAALEANDAEAFVDAFSAHPVASVQARDDALVAARSALARPDWAKFHSAICLRAGLMAVASKATSEGRELLRKAIDDAQLSPNSRATARLAIGNSYAADRRFDVAADAYRALLDGDEQLSPGNLAWAHANLGSV